MDQAAAGLRPGDFLVAAGSRGGRSRTWRKQTGVDFTPLRAAVSTGVHDLKRQRVAMYQRYGGGNIDEGWTRFVLEQFNFPYTSIFDPEIKAGNLNAKYDVLIFPNDSTATITGETGQRRRPAAEAPRCAAEAAAGGRGGAAAAAATLPPEYRTGLGTEGVNAIRDFVQKGGTLVTLNGAAGVPHRPPGHRRAQRAGRQNDPGILVPRFHAEGGFRQQQSHRLRHARAWARALSRQPGLRNHRAGRARTTQIAVQLRDRDLLESGWLVGEENLARNAPPWSPPRWGKAASCCSVSPCSTARRRTAPTSCCSTPWCGKPRRQFSAGIFSA